MVLQILGPAQGLSECCLERERRAVVHYLCDRETAGSPLSTSEGLWARVRTISQGGIRLLLGTSIQLGARLVIRMKTADSDSTLALTARVVGATMQLDGSWLVDCRFLNRLTEEQVLALL
jgi:hypothetical protein